ncbi:MAG: hypothetical protein ACK4X1_11935 [Terricaulis sp.]
MDGFTRRAAGLGLLTGAASCATTQTEDRPVATEVDQRLAPLARFVGHWRGAAEGEPGTGAVERSYVPILAGKFVEERNVSSYSSGEIHHHLAFWSLDRGRGRFVLRQFHQESFVNQFVATTADFVDGLLVVESESIENIPPGFRARETYRFSGSDAFEEVFEIAEPDADFAIYSRNRFTRVAGR